MVGIIAKHPVIRRDHLYPLAVWRLPEMGIVFSAIVTENRTAAPNFCSVSFVPPNVEPFERVGAVVKKDVQPEDVRRLFNEVLGAQ
jgi:hypothetical protein